MANAKGFRFREVVKNMGWRSILASLLVFLATVAVTGVVGINFFRTTRDNIDLQGQVDAVQAAKELDGYLLVRKNTVILAAQSWTT